MKIKGKDYSISELFNIVRIGMRWNKDPITETNDKEAIARKWLEENNISMGPFKNKAIAALGHYNKWCDTNKIDGKIRLKLKGSNGFATFLNKKFSSKQHGSTRLYEMNVDLSGYEEKEIKED